MRKKILVIAENIWPPEVFVTGASTIFRLQKKLSSNGFEIHILTTRSEKGLKENSFLEKNSEIKFHTIRTNFLRKIPIIKGVISKILFFFLIIKLNNKFHFDIIHEYTSSPNLFLISALYKKILKTKVVHTICVYAPNKFYNILPSRINSYLDAIIVTSKRIKELIKKTRNLFYIPLGIEYKKIQIKNQKNKKKMITFIGPLKKERGVFLYIKAIKYLLKKGINANFLICSYGKSLVDLNFNKNLNKIKNMKLKNTEILIGKQDIEKIMIKTDILVIPPISSKGTLDPQSILLEAMSLGKCVIASKETGNIINDNKNGLIIKNNNYKDIIEKVEYLINNNKKIEQLGQNAQKKAKEFDLNISINKLIYLYNHILKNK